MPRRRRVILAALLLAASVLSIFHVFDAVARPVLGPLLDARAERVAEGIAVRAGTAFAMSKAINAVLSFAEEASVSAGLLFEGSVHPAAFLRPVNNLVDQFARIMLAVAAAALAITFLLQIGAALGTSWLLAVPLLAFTGYQLVGDTRFGDRVWRFGKLTLVLVLAIRLAVPLAVTFTGVISQSVLQPHYAKAEAGLGVFEQRSETAAKELGDDGAGVLDTLKDALTVVRESFGNLFEHLVTMVTVFFLETVFLPLAIVGLFYWGILFWAGRGSRGA